MHCRFHYFYCFFTHAFICLSPEISFSQNFNSSAFNCDTFYLRSRIIPYAPYLAKYFKRVQSRLIRVKNDAHFIKLICFYFFQSNCQPNFSDIPFKILSMCIDRHSLMLLRTLQPRAICRTMRKSC